MSLVGYSPRGLKRMGPDLTTKQQCVHKDIFRHRKNIWKVRSPTVSCGCLGEVEEEEKVDFSIFTYRLWYLFESEGLSAESDSCDRMNYIQPMEFSRPEYWSG